MKNKAYRRGNSEHYRNLQQRSMRSRINRMFDVEYQLEPGAKLPWRARNTDAGFDLYALENAVLLAKDITYVHTGVHLMPPIGYFFYIAPRSGVTKAGIVAVPGICDATYTGEILAPLFNTTTSNYIVQAGDRIAQIIFAPILTPSFVGVEQFTVDGNEHRGPKGFGSSGR